MKSQGKRVGKETATGKVNTILEAGELMNKGTRAGRSLQAGETGRCRLPCMACQERPTTSQWGCQRAWTQEDWLSLSKEPLDPTDYLISHPGKKPDAFCQGWTRETLTPGHSWVEEELLSLRQEGQVFGSQNTRLEPSLWHLQTHSGGLGHGGWI